MRLPASLISPLLWPWLCARITGPFSVTGTSPNYPHTEALHLFVPLPGIHFLCSSHYSSCRSRLASHLTWPFQTGVPWPGTLRWPPGLLPHQAVISISTGNMTCNHIPGIHQLAYVLVYASQWGGRTPGISFIPLVASNTELCTWLSANRYLLSKWMNKS